MRRGYLTAALLAVVLGVVYVAWLIGERAVVSSGASSTASVGLLLLGAWMFGRIASVFKLPNISAYLVFGVLVGPGVIGLIHETDLPQLEFVNDLAISLIALLAGGEIKLTMVRRSWRAINAITLAQTIFLVFGVGLVAWMVLPWVIDTLPRSEAWRAAMLVGVIAAASSPASIVAVLAELRAHGRMAQLALSSAVFKDLIVVTLFSIVLALVVVPEAGAEAGLRESLFELIAGELGMSVVVGVIVGLGLSRFVRKLHDQLPIVVVLACLGIGVLSQAGGLDPLIVALVAGLVMENMYPERSDPVFETLEELSLPVYCVFFAVAGAKIDIQVLGSVWMAAVGLVVLRAGLLWSSVGVGARIGGEEGAHARWLWTSFVPQAGVSLALVSLAERALGESGGGTEVFGLVIASIAMNQLVGPILFSTGLTRAGERDTAMHGVSEAHDPDA